MLQLLMSPELHPRSRPRRQSRRVAVSSELVRPLLLVVSVALVSVLALRLQGALRRGRRVLASSFGVLQSRLQMPVHEEAADEPLVVVPILGSYDILIQPSDIHRFPKCGRHVLGVVLAPASILDSCRSMAVSVQNGRLRGHVCVECRKPHN